MVPGLTFQGHYSHASVTLGKELQCPVPQFPPSKLGDSNRSHLIGSL